MQFSYNRVCVESLGYTLPTRVVSSSELEGRLAPLYRRLKLPEGRLELMTGIASRRFWPLWTAIADISALSCRLALEAAGVDPRDVGVLIHGSVCRDHLEPATACRTHQLAGLPSECQIFDVSNACLGILNGIMLAANMIELGQVRYALVVGSENGCGLAEATIQELNTNESLTRQSIKSSIASLTIGSASCAVLLAADSVSRSGARLDCGVATANTRFSHLCRSREDHGGGQALPLMETNSEALMMEGIDTGRQAFERFVRHPGWERDQLSASVCHQVGATHRKLLLEALGIPEQKDFISFPELGNTGSAALPVTLARGIEAGFIRDGQRVALLGIGSGINCIFFGLLPGAIACRGQERDQFAPPIVQSVPPPPKMQTVQPTRSRQA